MLTYAAFVPAGGSVNGVLTEEELVDLNRRTIAAAAQSAD